jgi:hypothetical protein
VSHYPTPACRTTATTTVTATELNKAGQDEPPPDVPPRLTTATDAGRRSAQSLQARGHGAEERHRASLTRTGSRASPGRRKWAEIGGAAGVDAHRTIGMAWPVGVGDMGPA